MVMYTRRSGKHVGKEVWTLEICNTRKGDVGDLDGMGLRVFFLPFLIHLRCFPDSLSLLSN